MLNTHKRMAAALVILVIAVVVTAIIFNTRFAKVTIDAWSFAASIFLVGEAFLKMRIAKDTFWPNQFLRVVRVIIGTCIFTIHTCQVIYGI